MKYSLKQNREKLYRLCQAGGWSLYLLIDIFLTLIAGRLSGREVLLSVYITILGLAFTHIYRSVIKTRKWITLGWRGLAFRAVFAGLVISAVVIGIIFLILKFTHMMPEHAPVFAAFIGNIFFFFLLILVWSLIYFVVHYFENYRTSEIEKLVWEAAVKDFELKTLKSQLNPHFMFNAMNSIRALIEENPERAKEAITQLSNIFRYSLRIERIETVPFEDELRVVEDYLALEKVRYEERLSYTISVDSAARKVEIPPMMLQTLVENGIKHGISSLPAGGEVAVDGRLADSVLEITISNTGSVTEEALRDAKGFGVANTKQRLHLLYGGKGEFRIFNQDGKVITKVKIPAGVIK